MVNVLSELTDHDVPLLRGTFSFRCAILFNSCATDIFELSEMAMWQHFDSLHEKEEIIECHCERESNCHTGTYNRCMESDNKRAQGI